MEPEHSSRRAPVARPPKSPSRAAGRAALAAALVLGTASGLLHPPAAGAQGVSAVAPGDISGLIRAVADAGHEIVISTGRSVVATLPILRLLDLQHGFAVCSNGAVTIRLDPTAPDGYTIDETVTFDPRQALTLVMEHAPHILVAVEEVGVGFKVARPYPEGVLQGEQVVVPFEELVSRPTTRVTFHDPEGQSEDFLELVERIGLHGVSYAVGYTAWLDLAPEGEAPEACSK